MKKIIIIDGGPRKNMNTAKLLQSFAEGAKSAGGDIEVKTVRLYDIDYRGCMSCMACKLRGKASNICRFKDALAPILEEIAQADGLVLGSPIYFGEVTGQMRAFLERLAFPWLSYNDYSLTAPKRMPVVLVETMNGTPERNNSNHFGTMEWCITLPLANPNASSDTTLAKWRNTAITNWAVSLKRQNTPGAMPTGRRTCKRLSRLEREWQNRKRYLIERFLISKVTSI